MNLEDAGVLCPDNLVHRFILQMVYLPKINARLQTFRSAWNLHRIRSECNRTPQQIWLDGMLVHQNSGHTGTNEVFATDEPVLVRLQQRLVEFGVALPCDDPIANSALHAIPVAPVAFTSDQELRLTVANGGTYISLMDKYSACVAAVVAKRRIRRISD
jgi:hypothetical protein